MKLLRRTPSRITPEGTRVERLHKRMSSENGAEPFRRCIVLAASFLVLACVIGVLSMKQYILYPPTSLTVPSKVIMWLITTIVGPHVVLYACGVMSALYILPQQTWGYSAFLLRQGARRIAYTLLITESLMVSAVGLVMSQSSSESFLPRSYGLSGVQSTLWNTAVLSFLIPVWVGYRAGWKVYRDYGARTMQDRYEDHLRNMEIVTSGQFWDKWVARPTRHMFARDGSRPRGGFLWFIITPIVFMFFWGVSTWLGSAYLMGVAVFASITTMTAIFAAVSKYRDGLHSRFPMLLPVRFPDTEDVYNPSSTGVRVFERR